MIEIVPNWHPIFVHFTVALLSMSTLFFIASKLFPNHRLASQWLVVAQWNLWFGAGFAVITGFTGWLAFNSVAHDTPSHLAMTDHRNWALAVIAIFVPLGLWSIWGAIKKQKPNSILIVLMVAGFAVLMSTAWRGGEVVYRHGLGVMSMPQVKKQELAKPTAKTRRIKNADGHDHEH